VDLLREKRALNRGFGDTLNKGFELIVAMALLGAAGYGLDRLFGSDPVLFVAFMVLAFIGQTARLWYAYDAAMKRHESQLPSHASRARSEGGES
jgi:F0F1-type ATP synthase assembly protein I